MLTTSTTRPSLPRAIGPMVVRPSSPHATRWDYLILTASNERQASAYRQQLELRERLGLLTQVGRATVIADPQGRRVGSGGSTVACLAEIVRQEAIAGFQSPDAWLDVLRRLRILIVHAGGDSRRLPAYGPCGKVFVPVPGPSDSALGSTLFDRQIPAYLDLPPLGPGAGQVVITAGDVLLRFPAAEVAMAGRGFTGLGCLAPAEQARRHGVYCIGPDGQARRVLQKPSPDVQRREGALDRYGEAVLDIGVVGFDAETAVRLMEAAGVDDVAHSPPYAAAIGEAILNHGLDFYREICCALGTETTPDDYLLTVRSSGSRLSERLLRRLFDRLSPLPLHVEVLRRCDFLHFGTTREILTSGQSLLRHEAGLGAAQNCLSINNDPSLNGRCQAISAWVEGCSGADRLTLAGENVVVGVDLAAPLDLPAGACLDVLPGRDRDGESVAFVRCYLITDLFNNGHGDHPTLGAWAFERWCAAAGAVPDTLWDETLSPNRRSGWNARLFPAEHDADGFRRWLWMLDPDHASEAEFRAWRAADRYSLEEMASLADQEAFHRRRGRLRSAEVSRSLAHFFRPDSGFSAEDLAHVLANSTQPGQLVAEALEEARHHADQTGGSPRYADPELMPFTSARILHTLGTALDKLKQQDRRWEIGNGQDKTRRTEVSGRATSPISDLPSPISLQEAAFEQIRRTIVEGARQSDLPASPLRADEIVWGRIPARLDLAGGWTDTPPFALEHGGAVLNAAVHLNGQPPIQVYARLDSQLRIRLRSIDRGTHLDIHNWDELLDYATATGEFSLAKGALAMAGFQRGTVGLDPLPSLHDVLDWFGGGLELTTLAAIPKGSGLGTSSIMGTVLLAVVHRVMGRQLSPTELFHGVLRLEQAMTTGGGWQDQIGGALGGLKLVTTEPGLIPNPAIRYVPADVLDPATNGGSTLLYYTGITRLAKNILGEVVGRYLDRNRHTVATLRQIHELALEMTEVMARKDLPQFGRLIDRAWRLNKQLDPNSSNDEIESILARVRPHIFGAKLLGAGGGGFLLLVCKSSDDGARARRLLGDNPPNSLARFFDFSLSAEGLGVSVC